LSGVAFDPEVTVCIVESLFVQVTVSPTLAFIGFGEKASVALLCAPETMEAATLPPVEVELPLLVWFVPDVWLPVLVELVFVEFPVLLVGVVWFVDGVWV